MYLFISRKFTTFANPTQPQSFHFLPIIFQQKPNPSANETLRQSLARDIMDLKKLFTEAGYARKLINQQLKEVIRLNKLLGGFGK